MVRGGWVAAAMDGVVEAADEDVFGHAVAGVGEASRAYGEQV